MKLLCDVAQVLSNPTQQRRFGVRSLDPFEAADDTGDLLERDVVDLGRESDALLLDSRDAGSLPLAGEQQVVDQAAHHPPGRRVHDGHEDAAPTSIASVLNLASRYAPSPPPVRDLVSAGAALRGTVILSLVAGLGVSACNTPNLSQIATTPTDSRSQAEAPTATTMPGESVPSLPASERLWYEVDRSGDLEGNLTRTLLIGTLDGDLTGRIPLAEQRPEDRDDPNGTFDLTDPQAAGLFGGRVLVWARDEEGRQIESVDVESGRTETLLMADDVVHSATADQGLSRIFFVTADPVSGTPIGLWQYDVGDASPTRLAVDMGNQAIGRANQYRLTASHDGAWLAVETRESIIMVNVMTGATNRVDVPGPVVGLASASLVAYGPREPTGGRSLVAFSLGTLDGAAIAPRADGAQLAFTSVGEFVAYMLLDPEAGYEIWTVDLRTLDHTLVYEHPAPEPLMAMRDRSFVGEDVPESILLGTSFIPAIEGERDAPVPTQSWPILLDVVQGETERLGPFRDRGS